MVVQRKGTEIDGHISSRLCKPYTSDSSKPVSDRMAVVKEAKVLTNFMAVRFNSTEIIQPWCLGAG